MSSEKSNSEAKTLKNDSLKTDIDYCLQWNRYFLLPIGIWVTEKNPTILNKIYNALVIVVCYCLLWFLMVVVGYYALVEEPQSRMKLVGPMSFCVMAILKYNSLVSRLGDIKNCICHVKDDWTNLLSAEHREIMLKGAKSGRFLGFLSAVFMYSGGLFFHGVVPISIMILNMNSNVTVKPLTYPVYSGFFDVSTSPTYELIFMVQSVIGYLEYNITIALCSLASLFILHSRAQLGIVMNQMNYLVDGEKSEVCSVQERLILIIKRHRRALSFVMKVEDILNLACLVECIGCTANICFIGYYFLQELEKGDMIGVMTFLILYISLTYNIFIFCYIGEIITEQSKKIGRACYDIEWYRLPYKKALNLLFIIQISHNPAKITAGKFIGLSLASFTSVVKSAMAYLNVLRAMTV